jgi:hypothetical protein
MTSSCCMAKFTRLVTALRWRTHSCVPCSHSCEHHEQRPCVAMSRDAPRSSRDAPRSSRDAPCSSACATSEPYGQITGEAAGFLHGVMEGRIMIRQQHDPPGWTSGRARSSGRLQPPGFRAGIQSRTPRLSRSGKRGARSIAALARKSEVATGCRVLLQRRFRSRTQPIPRPTHSLG